MLRPVLREWRSFVADFQVDNPLKNRNMIECSFNGRLGSEGAKVIKGKKGDFMSMDMATDIFGGGENKALWVRVKSSKPQHLKLAEYLTKGRLLKIVGVISRSPECWKDKEGTPRAMHVIYADKIEFINSGKNKQENGGVETHPSVKTQETEKPFEAPEEKADDLPF